MSGFLKLNSRDFLRGLLVTVISGALTVVATSFSAGTLPTLAILKIAGMTGASAGISYLLKNFVTNSEDKILKPEPTDGTVPK